MTKLAALVALMTCAACGNYEAEIPQGFAKFPGHSQFRAVSSDGVAYRVHREKNEPKADLAFWREALKKRMLDAGYAFVSDTEINGAADKGYLLELATPVGTQDYSYAVAVFVRDTHLVIAEAAGEVTRFRAHRDHVLAAVTRL